MKRFITFILASCFILPVFATDDTELIKTNTIQNRIDNVGAKILNANKIDKRVVFVYDNKLKNTYLNDSKTLTKRQIIVYNNYYQYISNDDELAGYLARGIAEASRSYDGLGDGWLSSIKIKAAPKKFELVFDKLAVDYMVKAGYNPLGLITFINKSYPQARQDAVSSHNLTSKRLAYIYERIYTQYPNFIIHNAYLENETYQNFLLTSQENRKLLKEKVNNSQWKKDLKYE
jgi:hypothetical protein